VSFCNTGFKISDQQLQLLDFAIEFLRRAPVPCPTEFGQLGSEMFNLQGLCIQLGIAHRDHAITVTEHLLFLSKFPLKLRNGPLTISKRLFVAGLLFSQDLAQFARTAWKIVANHHATEVIRTGLADHRRSQTLGIYQHHSHQPARNDTSVRIGALQSIPSHNIDSCAAVNLTTPCLVRGQTNRPRSNLFA